MSKASKRSSQRFSTQLWSLFNGEGKDILAIIAYAVIIGVCSLIVPVAVQALVSSVAAASVLQPIIVLSGFVAGILIFSSIMTVLQLIFTELLQRRLMIRCSVALAKNIPHIEVAQFMKLGGANKVPRFLEIFSIQKLVTTILLDGTAVFFQIIIGLVLVSFYHPYFLGISLLFFIYIFFLIFVLGSGGIETSRAQSDAKYSVLTWLIELAKIPNTFKTQHAEAYALRRVDHLVVNYLKRRSQHFLILLRQHIASLFLLVTGSALLLGLGGWLVIQGQLTLGQLVAAELVFSLVLSAIIKLCRHLEKFYDLVAAVGKLDSLFDLPYESQEGVRVNVSNNSPEILTLSDVSLSSEVDSTPIIENAHLSLREGEKAVIWGPNGSGKSYLASAIFNVSEGVKGRIEIDGLSTSSIQPHSLRAAASLVRGVEIFEGTIHDNISIHSSTREDGKIYQLLKDLKLIDKINSLQGGINSSISGFKHSFSHGEALRLMIIRGILSNPRLLVIDGTLDAMDIESQELVLNLLSQSLPSLTVLLLTHEVTLAQSLPKKFQIENRRLKGENREA